MLSLTPSLLFLVLNPLPLINAQEAVSQIPDGQIQAGKSAAAEAPMETKPAETAAAETYHAKPHISGMPKPANMTAMAAPKMMTGSAASASASMGYPGEKANGTAPTVPVLTSAAPFATGEAGSPGTEETAPATTGAVKAAKNGGDKRMKVEVAMVELAGIVGLVGMLG